MSKSAFVSDDTWNQWINDAAKALHDKLVSADEDYFTISTTITWDGTSISYALPSDFYKFRGIDYSLGGLQTPMHKFEWSKRNNYQLTNGGIIRYRIVAGNLEFRPTPAAGSCTLWYVPAFEALDEDDDEFDGINGWELYIVLMAAKWALAKEESDTTEITREIMEIEERINKLSSDRDHSEPECVTDIHTHGHRRYYMGDGSDC